MFCTVKAGNDVLNTPENKYLLSHLIRSSKNDVHRYKTVDNSMLLGFILLVQPTLCGSAGQRSRLTQFMLNSRLQLLYIWVSRRRALNPLLHESIFKAVGGFAVCSPITLLVATDGSWDILAQLLMGSLVTRVQRSVYIRSRNGWLWSSFCKCLGSHHCHGNRCTPALHI